MSMTDPVADFLTRIRNGLHADRDDVEMPASNFKAEIARILREQGYIEDYAVEAARVGRVLRVTLKYTEDRKPVIQGIERVSKPGRRAVRRGRHDPEGAGRNGHDDRVDLARRDDRPRGAPRRRGWRARGKGLVSGR